MRVGNCDVSLLLVPHPPARGGGRCVHHKHAEAERRVLFTDHDVTAAA